MVIKVKAIKDKSGILIKPKYSTNFVVQEIPAEQGAKDSGIIE